MNEGRVDRKYVLSSQEVERVLAEVQSLWSPDSMAKGHTQRYQTDYFDTDDLCLFHAARRQLPQRSKVRVRYYLDTDSAFIEVKSRNRRGETIKTRQTWTGRFEDAHEFLVGALGGSTGLVGGLIPTARTSYERTAATIVAGGRMTLDRNLLVGHRAFTHRFGDRTDELVVLETKSPTQSPTPVDRHLWDQRIRPVSLSKYALAVASFRPDLPLNRWSASAKRLRTNP